MTTATIDPLNTRIRASAKQNEVIHATEPEVILEGKTQSGKSFAVGHKFVRDAVSRDWPPIEEGRFNGFAAYATTAEQARATALRSIRLAASDYGLEYIDHVTGPDYIYIKDNRIPITPHGIGTAGSESALLGRTYGLMVFEELTECDKVAFEYAVTRSSMPGAMLYYLCNPRSPSHWVKKELIDSESPNIRHWSFGFRDNPTLTKDYIDRIRGKLSPTQFKRLFLGQWVDNENAIWQSHELDQCSISWTDFPTEYDIIIVSVDPAWSTLDDADHTGIVVLGAAGQDIYLLHEEKLKVGPDDLADNIARVYTMFGASLVVYESNRRGREIPGLLTAAGYSLSTHGVASTASKRIRAEATKPGWTNGYVWLPANAPDREPGAKELDMIRPTSRLETLRSQLVDVVGEGDEDDDVFDACNQGVRHLLDRNAQSSIFISDAIDVNW